MTDSRHTGRRVENLAPAGTFASLERACAAGADAVYLGYSAFSARAGAGNFDRDELKRAVHFAHLHHMKVHVTVNTLVKDEEIPQVVEVLRYLADLCVDAVLVQDLGVLSILRSAFPSLPVHASTQMAIHNRTGCLWCRDRGMTRVVLARECSLEEIRRCTGEGIEIEVFCHGAQCVCVSGECLLSSSIGGRSGNRGRCAQPCRMLYTFRGKLGAYLSPRDVCTRDRLDELADAGVSSIKIEGRLKRPEYVFTVASSYRRGLDLAQAGAFEKADTAEREGLMQIFQRGGFMEGFAFGCEDAAVIDEVHVSHLGLEMGEVLDANPRFARVRLTRDLHNEDQLAFGEGREGEMMYSGPEVKAGAVAQIRLRPGMKTARGQMVRRLSDAEQLRKAMEAPIPRIPVRASLRAAADEVLTLSVTDGESTVTVQGDRVECAQKRAMTEEDAVRALSKTGDTPFVLEACEVCASQAFVPQAQLNALRRDALAQLEEARAAAFGRSACEEERLPPVSLTGERVRDQIVFSQPAQLAKALELFPEALPVWHPSDYRADALERQLKQICQSMPCGVWLQLPMVTEEDTLEALWRFARTHRKVLGGVVLGSVGQLGRTWPVPFGAGPGIPVMNRYAASFLFSEGCAFAVASEELTGEERKRLVEGCGRILLPACGRQQLMLLHTCPARVALGLRQGHAACRMCDEGCAEALQGEGLTDLHGATYPLLRERLPEGCLVRLMSSQPLNVIERSRAIGAPLLMDVSADTDSLSLINSLYQPGHWSRKVE